MIFVTVGTHTQQFNRLLKEVDRLIEKKRIREEVIAQIGHSTYEPKNFKYFRFKPFKEIIELNKRASIIISHAGAGNIITALEFNKPLILVPRMKKFNEHTDNHQIRLAKKLETQGRAIVVCDIKSLWNAIIKIKKKRIKKLKKKKTRIVEIISDYILSLGDL